VRRLVHIPVVHSEADMGSAREKMRRTYIAQRGHKAWEESRRAIAEFWTALDRATDALPLDFRKVRLYQDGLPVCGLEDKIVHDLAAQGVPNHRILAKLVERGGILEGTEDPELLREEYELLMSWLPAAEGKAKPAARQHDAAALKDLLERRDSFIAARIDLTLRPGETGILFLGALHHVIEKLPATIAVVSIAELLQAPAP
jgi:hypothetical protein